MRRPIRGCTPLNSCIYLILHQHKLLLGLQAIEGTESRSLDQWQTSGCSKYRRAVFYDKTTREKYACFAFKMDGHCQLSTLVSYNLRVVKQNGITIENGYLTLEAVKEEKNLKQPYSARGPRISFLSAESVRSCLIQCVIIAKKKLKITYCIKLRFFLAIIFRYFLFYIIIY